MKKLSRMLALALALMMLLVCVAPLMSCNQSDEPDEPVIEEPDRCENCGAEIPPKEEEELPPKDYTVAFIISAAIVVCIGVGAVVTRYFLDKKNEIICDTPTETDSDKK